MKQCKIIKWVLERKWRTAVSRKEAGVKFNQARPIDEKNIFFHKNILHENLKAKF